MHLPAANLLAASLSLPVSLPPTPTGDPSPILPRPTGNPLSFSSNDLLDPSVPCKPLTLIHCRGFAQPGNIGHFFGNEFCDAVQAELGEENVAVQGVEYNGLVLAAMEDGREEFVRVVEAAGEKCGNGTKVVVTGYSLGAYYLHASAPDFPPDVEISSAVTFGDMNIPNSNQPGFDVDVDMEKLPNLERERYKAFCLEEDDICQEGKGFVFKLAHMKYQEIIPEAVEFIKRWFERDEGEEDGLI